MVLTRGRAWSDVLAAGASRRPRGGLSVSASCRLTKEDTLSRSCRLAVCLVVAVTALSAIANAALAADPSPPFNQCPAIGADTSCETLIYIRPDGTLVVLTDPSQPPYDNIEDTLIGVQNDSNATVTRITL